MRPFTQWTWFEYETFQWRGSRSHSVAVTAAKSNAGALDSEIQNTSKKTMQNSSNNCYTGMFSILIGVSSW